MAAPQKIETVVDATEVKKTALPQDFLVLSPVNHALTQELPSPSKVHNVLPLLDMPPAEKTRRSSDSSTCSCGNPKFLSNQAGDN